MKAPDGSPPEYLEYLDARGPSSLGKTEEIHQALTLRALLVGAFLTFFLSTGAPYANMIIKGTSMCMDFSTPGAIFLFFVLVGLLNVVFKAAGRSLGAALICLLVVVLPYAYKYLYLGQVDPHTPGFLFSTLIVISFAINALLTATGRSLALNRSELIVVYIMLLMAASLCTMGLTEQILPFITAMHYYASPENKWAELLMPHVQDRLVVNDGVGNVSFYEGIATTGGDIPYGLWVGPILWWGIFLLALYVTMVSVSVVLRKQWVERERLAYPVSQVPLAMVRGEESHRLVNTFFKNGLMWIGFAIPMFVGSLMAFRRYNPAVFTIPLRWAFRIVRGTQTLNLQVSFAMLGFSYLINSDIAMGIWVFHILAKVQKGIFTITGVSSTQKLTYGVSDFPLMAYQGLGALLVLVGVSIWVARSHLKDVFLKAIGRAPEVDDSDEVMSYRSATVGVLGGTGVMTIWLWVMGMPLWASLVFVLVAFGIFIGVTRIVAEGGVAAVRSPMIAPNFMISGIGSSALGPMGVMNMGFAFIWASDIRVFVMATCTNGLKLIEGMDRRSRRYVFWAILIAILVSIVGSFWMIFHVSYKHGGINLNGWFFKGAPATAFDQVKRNMEPTGVYWPGIGSMAGGGLVMALLMFLRQRFVWWPLHPLGFPIGANHMMNTVWFNVFLAWFIKSLILRYGGGHTYRRSQAFFLGLIAGQMCTNGIWLVIDYFTGKIGNAVFHL